MGKEDFAFDREGLECDILRVISMQVVKNTFEPCAINEVTNLGNFWQKNRCSFFLVTLAYTCKSHNARTNDTS